MKTRTEVTSLQYIPRGSRIAAECSDGSTYITFNHLDGAYSHCTTEGGGTVHLARNQPLSRGLALLVGTAWQVTAEGVTYKGTFAHELPYQIYQLA